MKALITYLLIFSSPFIYYKYDQYRLGIVGQKPTLYGEAWTVCYTGTNDCATGNELYWEEGGIPDDGFVGDNLA